MRFRNTVLLQTPLNPPVASANDEVGAPAFSNIESHSEQSGVPSSNSRCLPVRNFPPAFPATTIGTFRGLCEFPSRIGEPNATIE